MVRFDERWQAHHQQPGNHGHKAQAVQEEAGADIEAGHEQAGYRWADDASSIDNRAVERDGVH